MMYSVRSKALHVTSLLIVIFFIGITYFLGYLRLYLQTDGNGIQSTSGKLQQPEKIYLRIEDNHIPTENQHLRTEDQHALTQNKQDTLHQATTHNYVDLMKQLNNERVAQDDPRLIKLIRDHYILPPSSRPYNLSSSKKLDYSQYGQTLAVDHRLNSLENGFFVECGALEGERLSNSLYFEKTRKWGGLLIEPDPEYFAVLKSKNRKAFSINACLSVEPYPVEMKFNKNKMGRGRIVHSQEVLDWMKRQNFKKDELRVQCFPLYSILAAINRTTVDYFSLDIEGDELRVLQTIPYKLVDFKVLTVECHNQKRNGPILTSYLKTKGYKNVMNINIDILFAKSENETQVAV